MDGDITAGVYQKAWDQINFMAVGSQHSIDYLNKCQNTFSVLESVKVVENQSLQLKCKWMNHLVIFRIELVIENENYFRLEFEVTDRAQLVDHWEIGLTSPETADYATDSTDSDHDFSRWLKEKQT